MTKAADNSESRYVWKQHKAYGGVSSAIAVEVSPRSGEIHFWRFVVPKTAFITQWGHGPAGGAGNISWDKSMSIDGGDEDRSWFGSADTLSDKTSAYIVFKDALPEYIGFGIAEDPGGQPEEVEIIS